MRCSQLTQTTQTSPHYHTCDSSSAEANQCHPARAAVAAGEPPSAISCLYPVRRNATTADYTKARVEYGDWLWRRQQRFLTLHYERRNDSKWERTPDLQDRPKKKTMHEPDTSVGGSLVDYCLVTKKRLQIGNGSFTADRSPLSCKEMPLADEVTVNTNHEIKLG